MQQNMASLTKHLGLTRATVKPYTDPDDIHDILSHIQNNLGEICADAIVSMNIALPNGTVCSVAGKLFLAGLDPSHTIAIDRAHSFMESKIKHIHSIQVGPGTGQEDPIIRINIKAPEQSPEQQND